MKKVNTKNSKKERGITLIALVVTIVVILILAAISLTVIFGPNGVISRAKEAKERARFSQVKDKVDIILGDWQVEKNLYDKGLEEYLTPKVPSEVDGFKNNGDGTITIEKEGYYFVVDDEGKVIDSSKKLPEPMIENVKVVANSDGSGETLGAKSVDLGTTLYITFEHSIENGETRVEPEVPFAVTQNGTYTFTITGTVNKKDYTKIMNVTVDQFKPKAEISEIKVVPNSDGSGEAVENYSTTKGETLYITFEHSIENGETRVEPELPFPVTENGKYTFTVIGTVDGIEYPETVEVEVKQFIPVITIGTAQVVENSNGSGSSLSAQSILSGKIPLYITFAHSIENGTTQVEPSLPYEVTENGTYSFTVTGTVDGQNFTKSVNVTVDQFDNLEIGDYVNYTYDTVSAGYSLLSTQSGYSNQTVAQSSTVLKWRVLYIDEENDTIDLVSENPSDNKVYLQGSLGFNNGVYLINDICKKLYSNTSLGITARSLNLVDTERHLTSAGIAARKAYTSSNGTAYGSTYSFTKYRCYPSIYASQKGFSINGASVSQPAIDGSVFDPYNGDDAIYTTPTTSTYKTASSSITVTQTAYGIDFNTTNYGAAGPVISNTNWYWIASRCAYNYSSTRVYFCITGAADTMGYGDVFISNGESEYSGERLRPVVSLGDSLLDGTKDSSGAWNLK